jgi:hypothetical protein
MEAIRPAQGADSSGEREQLPRAAEGLADVGQVALPVVDEGVQHRGGVQGLVERVHRLRLGEVGPWRRGPGW